MRGALFLLPVLLLGVGVVEGGDRPTSSEAWVRVGHERRLRCDLGPARLAYRRALDRDLHDPEGRAGLGEVLLLQGEFAEALAEAELGLATGRGRRSARLWRVKALALLAEGDVPRARRAAARGVALDPADPRVLEALARAEFRSGDMEAARAAYERVVRLDPLAEEANHRLGSGFGPPTTGTPWREGSLGAAWEAARASWQAGDLDDAIRRFRRLCVRAPSVYKFRLGLGLAVRMRRRAGEVFYGRRAEAAYRLLPAPEVDGLREFVPDYDELGAGPRHAIRVAIAPAAAWLPALRSNGATHEVLSLDEAIAEAPHRADLVGRRVFDGRDYEHLRGVGGREAATGEEKLREAGGFGFHTFAHEFAHQVLAYAFPSELHEEVVRLHEAAVAGGHCLDWYAALNVEEYFAQGYEAFVSHVKRGCLKETRRHTRDELAEEDPALLAFLEAHFDVSYETEGAMRAFWAALQ